MCKRNSTFLHNKRQDEVGKIEMVCARSEEKKLLHWEKNDGNGPIAFRFPNSLKWLQDINPSAYLFKGFIDL